MGQKISKDAYTKEDLQLLDSLANQASIAIENARLYQQVQDFTTNIFSRINRNRWAKIRWSSDYQRELILA